MTAALPHRRARALKPGSRRPAKDLCSECGLCDTSYVHYVKEACAFLNQQFEPLEQQVHGRSRDLENPDELYFGVHQSMTAAQKREPIEGAQWTGIVSALACRIDTTAFKELVDLVGGVEVYVPKPMRYTDNTQKLYIDLPAGRQTLNGDQAEQFARFRYDELGDIGRVQRQQMLLRALREKLANPLILTKAPDLVKVLQKYVDTNLSFEELMALVSIGLQQDLANIRMVMLPGRPIMQDDVSYWRLDEGARDRLVSDFFNQISIQPIDRLAFEDLRVAIQDSSGKPEAAQALAESLAKLGIRRVYIIEDWPEPLEKTQIIAQRGDLIQAEGLQQQLNLGEVRASSDGDIGSDLTIRIGQDWQPTPSPKP